MERKINWQTLLGNGINFPRDRHHSESEGMQEAAASEPTINRQRLAQYGEQVLEAAAV